MGSLYCILNLLIIEEPYTTKKMSIFTEKLDYSKIISEINPENINNKILSSLEVDILSLQLNKPLPFFTESLLKLITNKDSLTHIEIYIQTNIKAQNTGR